MSTQWYHLYYWCYGDSEARFGISVMCLPYNQSILVPIVVVQYWEVWTSELGLQGGHYVSLYLEPLPEPLSTFACPEKDHTYHAHATMCLFGAKSYVTQVYFHHEKVSYIGI